MEHFKANIKVDGVFGSWTQTVGWFHGRQPPTLLSETRKHKEPSLWEWNAFRYDEDGSGFCVRAQFCVVFLCVCLYELKIVLYLLPVTTLPAAYWIIMLEIQLEASWYRQIIKVITLTNVYTAFLVIREKTSKELISICISCCMNLRLNYESSKHSLIWIWRGYC